MNDISAGMIWNEKALLEAIRSRAGRVGKQPAGRRLSAEQFERELMLLKMTNEQFDELCNRKLREQELLRNMSSEDFERCLEKLKSERKTP